MTTNNYKSRYHKYKKKYYQISRENNSNIFNLNDPLPFKTTTLSQNLDNLHKTFGNNFTIKWQDIELPMKLHQVTSTINNSKTWLLEHDNNGFSSKPIIIHFIDGTYNPIIDPQKIQGSYIQTIHKTEEYSGTQIVKLALKINEVLGAKYTILTDGAHVTCSSDKSEMSLSRIKLLEKGLTFYMNLGFEPMHDNSIVDKKYNNKEEMFKKLDDLLTDLRAITISDLKQEYLRLLKLLTKVVKTSDFDEISIKLLSYVGHEPVTSRDAINKKSSIDSLFIECREILEILNNTKETYLYKLIVNSFKDPQLCSVDYKKLADYLIYNQVWQIKYKENNIIRNHIKLFALLELFKDRRYIYYFNN